MSSIIIRSSWHSETCSWECNGQSDVPPSRGIWWSRVVLHKVSLTFTVMHQVSLTFSAYRHTPIEASGVHKQYYLRSSWHSEAFNWECSGQSDIPPSRGIWWLRVVLHKVSLTFTVMHQVSLTFSAYRHTPIEASGVHKQYYLRSSWHSEACNWECSWQSDVPPGRHLVVKSSTTWGQLGIYSHASLLCSPGNRNSAKLTNLWKFISMLFHRKHLCHSDETNPPRHSKQLNTRQVTQITYLALYFQEPLIIETQNLCHWIWHPSNPKYMPLKPFWCIFPNQNQQQKMKKTSIQTGKKCLKRFENLHI